MTSCILISLHVAKIEMYSKRTLHAFLPYAVFFPFPFFSAVFERVFSHFVSPIFCIFRWACVHIPISIFQQLNAAPINKQAAKHMYDIWDRTSSYFSPSSPCQSVFGLGICGFCLLFAFSFGFFIWKNRC